MAIKYVKRYGPFDRVLHWIAAVSFAILVLSGLGLFESSLMPIMELLGGAENAIAAHKYIGIVFAVSSLLMILMHLKDTLAFDSDDAKWIGMLGGYLSPNAKEPPMGKYNTGQKIFGIVSLFATIGLLWSGWVLWHPFDYGIDTMRTAALLLSALFVLMGVFMVIHIYLGTIGNPGTLSGILYGEVSEAWAKKHSPKWLAKLRAK